MKELKANAKGGAFKTGVWIQRVTPYENNEENGYLTQGRSYQVLSPEHYSKSRVFLNKSGNPVKDANTKLAEDCVMLRDDEGKVRLFGARNFKLTSKTKDEPAH